MSLLDTLADPAEGIDEVDGCELLLSTTLALDITEDPLLLDNGGHSSGMHAEAAFQKL